MHDVFMILSAGRLCVRHAPLLPTSRRSVSVKVKVGLLLSLLAIFVLIILGISSVATAGPKLSGISATDPSGTGPLVHYVSERVPVRGESVERGAMRPSVPASSPDAAPAGVEATNPVSNSWQLLGSMPGATV